MATDPHASAQDLGFTAYDDYKITRTKPRDVRCPTCDSFVARPAPAGTGSPTPDDERAIMDVLEERDRYFDMADRLAAAVGGLTGVDIGEHSSMNDPWVNALEAAEARSATPDDDLAQCSACNDKPGPCRACGGYGDGSPTPADAPDEEISLLEDQDGAPYPEEVQEAHRYAIADLRAELSQVQKERDTARGDLVIANRSAWANADSLARTGIALNAAEAERDEARSALAALRAEVPNLVAQVVAIQGVVGELVDGPHRPGYQHRAYALLTRLADALRALVTDQSPAAPQEETMNRYYFAARYSRHPEMRERRAELVGVIPHAVVTSRWIDCHGGELDESYAPEVLAAKPDECWNHGADDIEDLVAADTIVSFTGAGGGGKGGRHIEHGYAIASGKRLVVIGPRENIFHCHPRTVVFEDFAAFLASEAGLSPTSDTQTDTGGE